MWDFDFRPRCAAGACGLISFLLPFNLRAYLRGLKSQDNKTWHLGSLSDLELHGPNGILICGRVAPHATIYDFLFIISKKPNMSSAALVGFNTAGVFPLSLCGPTGLTRLGYLERN